MEYTQTSTDSNNPKPEIPTPDDEISDSRGGRTLDF